VLIDCHPFHTAALQLEPSRSFRRDKEFVAAECVAIGVHRYGFDWQRLLSVDLDCAVTAENDCTKGGAFGKFQDFLALYRSGFSFALAIPVL
jgi:hypothetical protein